MTTLLTGAFTAIINAATQVFTLATDAEGMGPYFVLGIGVSLVMAGILVVRRLIWGA